MGLLEAPKIGWAVVMGVLARAVLILILMLVLTGCGLLPMTVSETPAPASPTAVKVIVPELASLDVTQAALNIQGTELALHSTELANVALSAAITQQAEIYGTQQAWQAIHYAMTATVDEQIAIRATEQAWATADSARSSAAFRESVTKTAVTWQSTAAAATQAAIVDEWAIAEIKRTTAEWWAPLETVLWRILIPLAVAGIVFMVARAFAVMLTRRYGTPVEVQSEAYRPDVFVEPNNQTEENEIPYTKIMVPAKDGRSGHWVDVKIYPEKLPEYAVGIIINKKAVAEKYWTGSANPFSIPEYRLFRDSMILAGLARWINPAFHDQGFSLSQEGWLALSLIAIPAHSPIAVPVSV